MGLYQHDLSDPGELGGVRMGVSKLAQQGGQKISRLAAGEAAKVGCGGVHGRSCSCPIKKSCACFWYLSH